MNISVNEPFHYPNFSHPEKNIIILPYKEKMLEFAKSKCKLMMGEQEPIKACVKSVFPAFDCIARSRVGRLGDLYDNYSYCRGNLDEGISKLNEFYSSTDAKVKQNAFRVFDETCRELSNAREPFI